MKPEFAKNGYCNCHNPEEWKVNDKIPISWSEEFNEYHIMCEGGGWLLMNYCYRCGGKLPDSLRGQYFCELDKSEVDEAFSLGRKIDTVEKMRQVLGEPDKIVNNTMKEEDYFFVSRPNKKPVRWYIYNKRWKSLDLGIHEYEDGTLGLSAGPKYIGRKDA